MISIKNIINKKLKRILLVISAISIFFIALFFVWPISASRLSSNSSLKIISKEGNVLRQFRSEEQGAYSEWINLHEFPPFLIKTVIQSEDKRFYFHPGFDLFSLVRAAIKNVVNLRITSGGSTITQQLVRIVYKDLIPDNKYLRKVFEIVMALKIELHCSKDRILECYLNRVPLKYNQIGLGSAAKRIFSRDIRFLTKEEYVALVVLIRQNNVSDRYFSRRFNRLWTALSGDKPVLLEQIKKSIYQNDSYAYYNKDSKTLHVENWIKNLYPGLCGELKTDISENLNDKINSILNSELKFLEKYDAENGAVVVLKLSENELRLVSMVGSKNFHGALEGQVNGCVTVRSAGSTLKPFLYGLAMESYNYSPNSILHDREITVPSEDDETYRPKNYDMSFWGPITLREALGASRNIPAIAMINEVGVPKFYDYLIKAGFDHLVEGPQYYGPGLILGTGGASLIKLSQLYSAILNKGKLLPVYIGKDHDGENFLYGKQISIMSEKTAYRLIHILSDKDIRRRSTGNRNFLDFPFDVAAKTGTSKDFRDAWTIGFTSEYIVGVWIGNFSGKEMKRISGSWGAGRVFQQVIRLVAEKNKPKFKYPNNFILTKLCRKSGFMAQNNCPSYMELVDSGDKPIAPCSLAHGFMDAVYNPDKKPVVISPIQGESYIIDPLISKKIQFVPIKISYQQDINSSKEKYFYQINNGKRKFFNNSIEEAVELQRGEHVLRLYFNNEIYETVNFYIR